MLSADLHSLRSFLIRVSHVPPIKDSILQRLTPTEAQAYTWAFSYKLSVAESKLFRNSFLDIFPRWRVANAASRNGLKVVLVGKNVKAMHTRIFDPGSRRSLLGHNLTIGLSIRGARGEWPLVKDKVQGTIHDCRLPEDPLCLGPSFDSGDKAIIALVCGMLLSNLAPDQERLSGCNVWTNWVAPEKSPIDGLFGHIRLIWLEASLEILIDPRQKLRRWTQLPKTLSALSLVEELVRGSQQSPELVCAELKGKDWTIFKGVWCLIGSLAENSAELRLNTSDRYLRDLTDELYIEHYRFGL